MTDRINALTVALERDIRDDDIRPLVEAIKQLRGVLRVEAHVVDTIESWVQRSRVQSELGKKLMAVIYPPSSEVSTLER